LEPGQVEFLSKYSNGNSVPRTKIFSQTHIVAILVDSYPYYYIPVVDFLKPWLALALSKILSAVVRAAKCIVL